MSTLDLPPRQSRSANVNFESLLQMWHKKSIYVYFGVNVIYKIISSRPVGHVLGFSQRANDVAKCTQRLVDVFGLPGNSDDSGTD